MTIKGVNFHLPTRGQFSTAVDSLHIGGSTIVRLQLR
jgi:hypothetical protein